ncbi:cell division protein FtsL [Cytobacillus horneckiae]|uniref:DUF2802 domain-containing protein n=1 Tax=Cytobacillus horneckiae TaxID=549687 RepID=A0A2N0ZGH1_9BACI|nr:hypothetical protein [Cytobacillus horneckiae]MBN6888261.1 hypothetical protein [Cytobacillus horneckiae]MCM3177117.1 hypothetical protein [Cytobacillus horneckiae]MEC1154816.1 hypothetical protein [Cytobacillus horneckiae]MED2940310.1 hypothetical protein [Cytobacillus horneckiae]PKG28610.1 hypothetical protein CWS20_12760 [Cytobacillus horneckiae]
MEWVLAILLGAAVVLLILSFVKAKQSKVQQEQHIDQVSFSLMDEIHQLQQQIKRMEIDAEITAQEAGVSPQESEHRALLREIIDLHRRGYSYESIATKKKITVQEAESLLAPYGKHKVERSKVAQ